MMFDKLCIEKIYNDGKWQTRRRFNPSRRPAVPGAIHKLKIDRTKNDYGLIEIHKIWIQKFGDISESDVKAEGFDSISEYKKYFQSVNGQHNPDDLIWVVEFRRIKYAVPELNEPDKVPKEWRL